MRPPLHAFIFDIDGTLVDSNELHVESWDRSFRHFGKQFSNAELRAQIGKGSDQYLPEFLTQEELALFGDDLDRYRSELFQREYLPRIKPFPEVRELFARIREDSHRIVLATSGKKAEAEHHIELLGVGDLIDGTTTAEDCDRSKPAPDIFQAAVEKLDNVSSQSALVIGDTHFDVEAANRAGLPAVGFLCGGTAKETLVNAGAIAIFYDPADLVVRYSELLPLWSARSAS